VKREHRTKIQLRAADIGGKPGVTLHVIRPNVVDDYGSVWNPHAFDESLSKRLPTLTWSHDWQEPLGPATGFRTSPDGPEIDFVFSDFDAVPMARRAHAQVLDGTILDCSVGFSDAVRRKPTDDELRALPGMVEYMESAGLDEVALVLRGAVPGAKVVSVRAGRVDFDALVEIAKRKVAGELTDDEARVAVELLGGDDDTGDDKDPPAGDPPPDPAAELAAVEAEADAAMDLIGRSAQV
jgi:HK97 family phage prohead protease